MTLLFKQVKETWKEDEDRRAAWLSENVRGEKIQTCLHLEISKSYECAKEQGERQREEERENENGEKLHERDRKSSLVVLAKTPWKSYWKNRIYWLGTSINYPTLKSYQLQKVGTQALNFSLLLHQSAWLSRHWGAGTQSWGPSLAIICCLNKSMFPPCFWNGL